MTLPAVVALVLAYASPPIGAAPDVQQVAGGTNVEACAWLDTVAVLGSGSLCSGTLVHPQVVVFAAHCGDADKQIHFGEESSGPGYTRNTSRCLANPDYLGVSNQGSDWAFCVLEEPILDIPVTPPLYGCELDMIAAGQTVSIVGFGNNTDAGGSGTKRWAETTLFSTFGNTANIGGDGVSTCSGDSGGSAFIQLADGSYRAISMVSTGIGCGQTGVHALMHPAVPWIEENAGIDITPCHDVDGTWHPNPTCDGFYAGGAVGAGTWGDWCPGTPTSGPSDSCGDPFDAITDTTAPTVAITAPSDRAELESGVAVTITLDADDGDGWGVKRVWVAINGDEQPVDDQLAPYVFANVNFPDGIYTVAAYAEDWGGTIGMSAEVTFGVGMAVPPDPDPDPDTTAADSTAAGSSGAGGTATTMDAEETTSDAGSSTSAGAGPGDGGGCGCRSGAEASPWLMVVLGGALRRRRRSGRVRRSTSHRVGQAQLGRVVQR